VISSDSPSESIEPSSAPSLPRVEADFFVELQNADGSLVDVCALKSSVIEGINVLVIDTVINTVSDMFVLKSMQTAAYPCEVQVNMLQLSYEGLYNSTYGERRLQGVEFFNEFIDALEQSTVEITEGIAALDESLADVVSIAVVESPSSTPSISPTLYPTTTPAKPSFNPSSVPTASSTDMPTLLPSFVPSIAPTIEPSLDPSLGPSLAPSIYPSSTPTYGGKGNKNKKKKKKKKKKKTGEDEDSSTKSKKGKDKKKSKKAKARRRTF